MSPDAAVSLVRLRDQHLERGEHIRAELDLDELVIETMQELISTGRYPATPAGDGLLTRDCHAVLCSLVKTATNFELCQAMQRWQIINDVLCDHDEDITSRRPWL